MAAAAPRAGSTVAEPDPDRIAAAVLRCPLVERLAAGRFGDVVTYLPGRRIPGVVVRDGDVTVAVVGRADSTAGALFAQVRSALSTAAPGCRAHVVFADITLAEYESETDASPPGR